MSKTSVRTDHDNAVAAGLSLKFEPSEIAASPPYKWTSYSHWCHEQYTPRNLAVHQQPWLSTTAWSLPTPAAQLVELWPCIFTRPPVEGFLWKYPDTHPWNTSRPAFPSSYEYRRKDWLCCIVKRKCNLFSSKKKIKNRLRISPVLFSKTRFMVSVCAIL